MATAEISTDPSPCPVPPALIVSHWPSTEAVQAHSRAAETVSRLVPPSAGSCPAAPTVTEQRLIGVGPVAVAVVADDPHPAASDNAAAAAAERTSDGRVTIQFVQLRQG